MFVGVTEEPFDKEQFEDPNAEYVAHQNESNTVSVQKVTPETVEMAKVQEKTAEEGGE